MVLAKFIRGRSKPIVTTVADEGWIAPLKPWARLTRTGAAALDRTVASAVASAKCVLIEEQMRVEKAVRKASMRAILGR